MNDTKPSRPAATRTPREKRRASKPLGELEFSDWYEIPVFEPDDDEVTEEIATSGRGPRRLMAKAKLARDARRAQRHPGWDDPAPEPARAASPRPEPEVAPSPAATRARSTAAPGAAPTASTVPVSVAAAAPEPVPKAKATPAPEPAPKAKAAPAPEPAPKAKAAPATDPVPVAEAKPPVGRDADTWVSSGPALTEESMRIDLERESVWRRRINDFLDRWAANEVAVAHRLDHSLERVISPTLPKSIPDLLAAATKRDESD